MNHHLFCRDPSSNQKHASQSVSKQAISAVFLSVESSVYARMLLKLNGLVGTWTTRRGDTLAGQPVMCMLVVAFHAR